MNNIQQAIIHAWQSYDEWGQVQGARLMKWGDHLERYEASPMTHYPLSSFSVSFALLVSYVVFVLLGTFIMKSDRVPAVHVRPLQFIYNPVQMALCAYMFIETAVVCYRNNYSLYCNDYNAGNPAIGNVLYVFFVSKALDFLDTVFIILSKKWNQLSFLHVYHHTTVFALYWLNFKVAYDGDMYITVFLNAFIHFIMYTYYFVSYHTKNIWWKKYLTILQMVQFSIMSVHAHIMYNNKCEKFPQNIQWLYYYYILSLLGLFIHFYIRSYCVSPSNKSKRN